MLKDEQKQSIILIISSARNLEVLLSARGQRSPKHHNAS